MPSIGPTLPPHLLSKRKREEIDSDNDSTGSESPKSTTSDGKKRRISGLLKSSPVLHNAQHVSEADENDQTSSVRSHTRSDKTRGLSSPTESRPAGPTLLSLPGPTERKPSKILGPTLPLADISERPPVGSQNDEDSDDDDFGPALPGSKPTIPVANHAGSSTNSSTGQMKPRAGRDDWMLAPPTSGDRTSTIDPSKMKNRGFSSGTRAVPKPGADISLWTETPEEKRKRLEEEMLGVRRNGQAEIQDAQSARADAKAEQLAKKVKAYNDKNRAAPLYSAKDGDADEDDPSKRVFDREKDIGGSKLSNAERKQMMNRAADFGSRFSKGSYL